MKRTAGLIAAPLLLLALSTMAATASAPHLSSVPVRTAFAATAHLVQLIDAFHARNLRRPTTAEGIAVVLPDNIAEVPRDPWGHTFRYVVTGDRGSADVISNGADGLPGGTGEASDISGRFGLLDSNEASLLPALIGSIGLALLIASAALASRSELCAGFFAGTSGTVALLLLALVSVHSDHAIEAAAALGLGIAALTGSIAAWKRLAGAPAFAALASVGAYFLLVQLITP